MLIVTAGCAHDLNKQPKALPHCPPQYSFAYADPAHGFRICLPAGVKGAVADYPKNSTVFIGFAVLVRTNLKDKRLIIVPGDYDLLKSAESFGRFTAGNVTFERAKLEEGSAGHLTLHIVYTWKSKNLHFDFELRSVNVNNFDPFNRPAEYNRDTQIKLTEQIMSTFRPTALGSVRRSQFVQLRVTNRTMRALALFFFFSNEKIASPPLNVRSTSNSGERTTKSASAPTANLPFVSTPIARAGFSVAIVTASCRGTSAA